MAAPIVYRWDDANAPVARGERRSLCDILYACLVTGYGSKPGAGWTREYVNATFDKAVFRGNPATGTGFYLQVDGASASVANKSKIMAYEVMTDVDTGLQPFNANALPELSVSSTAGTTARPWVLVADDRFFYLSIWNQITAQPLRTDLYRTDMCFGDIIKRYPSDAYACMLDIGVSGGGGFGFVVKSPSSTTGNSLYMPRKISGNAGQVNASYIRGGGPGSTDNTAPGSAGHAWSSGDPIMISRPYINNGEAYTFRGFVPGLYYPCHPYTSPCIDQLAAITVEGKTYLSIIGYFNGGAAGAFMIALDDWRV